MTNRGLINAPVLVLKNLGAVDNQQGEISSAQAVNLSAGFTLDNNAEVDRRVKEIDRMAVGIADDYAGSVPVYLTIMHGGLPFAAQLAMELGALGLDLEFDYLHATRYRGQTTGSDLVWKHRPATPLALCASGMEGATLVYATTNGTVALTKWLK